MRSEKQIPSSQFKDMSGGVAALAAALLVSVSPLWNRAQAESEDSATSAWTESSATTSQEPDLGTDIFDFRCISDGPRINATVNYNKKGQPLPTESTIAAELDRAGCEILGDDEGGIAYCRCSAGKLAQYKVPATKLPKLIHGTDDVEALIDLCDNAVGEFCAVEPGEIDETCPVTSTQTDSISEASSDVSTPEPTDTTQGKHVGIDSGGGTEDGKGKEDLGSSAALGSPSGGSTGDSSVAKEDVTSGNWASGAGCSLSNPSERGSLFFGVFAFLLGLYRPKPR